MNDNERLWLGLSGIWATALIVVVALIKGVDGQLYLTALAAIFGMATYLMGRRKTAREIKKIINAMSIRQDKREGVEEVK
mgnify:CR=1 FL=1